MGGWGKLDHPGTRPPARLVQDARYYWLLLAEGHLTRGRFASMLRRIAELPQPDG